MIEHPIYIPMVCFCDIPLSSLNFHMDVYAGYGIGLTKEWAEDKGLNPVMYVNENSNFFRVLSGSIVAHDFNKVALVPQVDQTLKALHEKGHEVIEISHTLTYLMSLLDDVRNQVITHVKPRVCKGKYRGRFDNYSYYDEKEWRYVPALFSDETPTFINNSLTNVQLNEYNNKIMNEAITFSAKEVKYVIVESSSDVEFIVNGLNDIKRRTKKYTDEDINYLNTKIITREQIIEDF